MDLFTSANPGYQQKISFELSFLQPNSPLAQMDFNAFFSLGFNEFDAANPIFAGLGETDPTDDAGTICQADSPVAHAEVLALDCISEAATTSGGLENAAELYGTGRLPSVHGANLFPRTRTPCKCPVCEKGELIGYASRQKRSYRLATTH